MKKPFLANFEVNEDNDTNENSEIKALGTIKTAVNTEPTDPDFFICGFTQRTRTTEDSDVDESII